MKLLLAAALTAPAPAADPGTANAFCADLRQIVAAAGERPAFESILRRREDRWLGGGAWCHRVSEGDYWRCSLSISDTPGGRRGLADRTRQCLADVEVVRDDPEAAAGSRLRDASTHLRSGTVLIRISEFGGPGMHQGWGLLYRVDAARAR